MNPNDITTYLLQHPDFLASFLEHHADSVADIAIPHPHSGRAISISERQLVSLREKNRMLESKLDELIQFGEENDSIGAKVHAYALQLNDVNSLQHLVREVHDALRGEFAVPYTAFRLWPETTAMTTMVEFAPVTDELRRQVEGLNDPACGQLTYAEAGAWLGEAAAKLRSSALVPLRRGDCVGVLMLASEDPQRFHAGMGTLYLRRIGELTAAAIQRVATT